MQGRKRWPTGTWMTLNSREMLRQMVGPEASKKLSGRRLARYAEVHPSFIDHLLAGRRSTCAPRTAVLIAEGLGVPLAVVFTPSTSSAAGCSVKQVAA